LSFALIIFDCDGVLIDSEPIANRVLADRLATVGIAMTPEEVMRAFVGRSRDTCIAMAGEMRGAPLPADFGAQWDAVFHEALARDVGPVQGVPDLLRSLSIPYCVASNGEPVHMRLGLEAAGLMPFVAGRLFSAAEVENPKPAPDIYLHAARKMGFPPERCVVVEDTPTGVRAGIAARMAVFAYVGGPQSDASLLESLGARPFSRMAELPALLGLS
jgi:HAD superfamily hydrolase (TIGR01509 family)